MMCTDFALTTGALDVVGAGLLKDVLLDGAEVAGAGDVVGVFVGSVAPLPDVAHAVKVSAAEVAASRRAGRRREILSTDYTLAGMT